MTKDTSSEDLSSKIKDNVVALREASDEDLDIIKDIVCKFYRGGRCPSCKGCRQPEEQLQSCKELYLAKIESRPMEKWTAEFDLLKVRKKQKIKEVVGMGLNCDKCYLSDDCPLYEPSALCAIDWEEEGDITPKAALDKIIELQYKRVNRASKIEEMDGGVPDQNLSTEIDRLQGLVQARNEMNMDRFSVKIEGQAQSGNSGGGLLASLFGNKQQAISNQEQPAIEDAQFTTIPITEKVTSKREK